MSEQAQAAQPPVVLRDVRGPSALGGGMRRTLDLLLLIAATEFKRAYFGTALGYLWTIGRPLLLFGVLLAVFTQAFHIGSQVPHYPVLLLFNIVLFTFFQEATNVAVTSVVAQEAIVRKTQFPRLVIPLSVVLTSLFNLIPNASRNTNTTTRLGMRLKRLVSTTDSGITRRGNCVFRTIDSCETTEVTATFVASWKNVKRTMLNRSSTG